MQLNENNRDARYAYNNSNMNSTIGNGSNFYSGNYPISIF